MSSMFDRCKSFNQDISKQDVSNVTDMTGTFYNCKSFNQDISNWNVDKVAFVTDMFNNCPLKEKYIPKFK